MNVLFLQNFLLSFFPLAQTLFELFQAAEAALAEAALAEEYAREV